MSGVILYRYILYTEERFGTIRKSQGSSFLGVEINHSLRFISPTKPCSGRSLCVTTLGTYLLVFWIPLNFRCTIKSSHKPLECLSKFSIFDLCTVTQIALRIWKQHPSPLGLVFEVLVGECGGWIDTWHSSVLF